MSVQSREKGMIEGVAHNLQACFIYIFRLIWYVWMFLPASMLVYYVCAWWPWWPKEDTGSFKLSYRQMWATVWAEGIKARPSWRVTIAFNNLSIPFNKLLDTHRPIKLSELPEQMLNMCNFQCANCRFFLKVWSHYVASAGLEYTSI